MYSSELAPLPESSFELPFTADHPAAADQEWGDCLPGLLGLQIGFQQLGKLQCINHVPFRISCASSMKLLVLLSFIYRN
jgi:hypothetical protein